jgi:hypothetical protein
VTKKYKRVGSFDYPAIGKSLNGDEVRWEPFSFGGEYGIGWYLFGGWCLLLENRSHLSMAGWKQNIM